MSYQALTFKGFQKEDVYVSCADGEETALYICISDAESRGVNVCLFKEDALQIAYMILTSLDIHPIDVGEELSKRAFINSLLS